MGYEKKRSMWNRFLLWCAHEQRKHWFVYFFLIKLSAVWYPLLLTFYGQKIHAINIDANSGSLIFTKFGWFITVVLLAIILIGERSLKYEGLANDVTYFERMNNILLYLRESKNNVCKSKCRTLLSEIKRVRSRKDAVPQRIISNPAKQLEMIANEISDCLCEFLSEEGQDKWRVDDIYVSIAYYRPADKSDWHWATEEKGLSLKDLLQEKRDDKKIVKSTFKHIIDSGVDNIFYNSKADAEAKGCYICDDLDERDENEAPLGSIACYKRTLKQDDSKYITYIVSVTTYSRRFVSDDSQDAVDNTKYNMKHLVLSDFMKRIDIEMCLLYLDDLWKQRASTILQK